MPATTDYALYPALAGLDMLKEMDARCLLGDHVDFETDLFPLDGIRSDTLGQLSYRGRRSQPMFVTPLGYAAACGQLDVVKQLLEGGEDIDGQHEHGGSTALFLALYGGHEPLAKLLLEEGASVTLTVGYHALHAAARNGFTSIIADLITKHDTDPNILDCDGAVPAVYALLQKKDKALATLLQLKSHGALLDLTIDWKDRPLTLDNVAMVFGNEDVLLKARETKGDV